MISRLVIDRLPGNGSPRDIAIWILHRLLPRSIFRALGLRQLRDAIEKIAADKSKEATMLGQFCSAAWELVIALERLAGYSPVVSEDRVFARAVPKTIKITETHVFHQEVFGKLGSGGRARPVGEVQVVLPYDGLVYFNDTARRDIAAQLAYVEPCERADALVGHLHFANHQYTNLQEVLGAGGGERSMKLQVPIRTPTITEPGHLSIDAYMSAIDLEYEPRSLDANPIQLVIEVIDEETHSPDRYSTVDSDKRTAPEKEVSRRISEQARSTQRLLVRMTVNLFLRVGDETVCDSSISPQMTRLSVDWPATATTRTLQGPDDFKKPNYDPVNRRLEWFDLDLALVSQDASESGEVGNQRTKRFSRSFDLEIIHPGALYEAGTISGQLDVEIQGSLLSGLLTRFYDAQGRLSDRALQISTCLKTDYLVQLDEAYLRQQRSPYLYLYFPDVVPDEDRFNVVITALTDQGFQVNRKTLASDKDRLKVGIKAERAVLPQPVILNLVVEGSGFDAIREKGVGGSETLMRKIKGGELKILMHASVSGNGELLIKEMNELHRILRERLPQRPS